MRDRFIALMVAVSVMCGVLSLGYAVDRFRQSFHEYAESRPPTCMEASGAAVNPSEHLWSAACISNDWPVTYCIESACIAFRGMP